MHMKTRTEEKFQNMNLMVTSHVMNIQKEQILKIKRKNMNNNKNIYLRNRNKITF